MEPKEPKQRIPARRLAAATALSVAALWMAQPPWMLWPLAFIALVPLVYLIRFYGTISKRGYATIWAVTTLYWLLSLQGLRHAHWAMYFCWIALSAYLAAYHVLFLVSARALVSRRLPLSLAVAVAWTGQECLRGYMLTGISVLLLGHTLSDVPRLIQVADLFGTYGVSFLIASANVGVFQIVEAWRLRKQPHGLAFDVPAALAMLVAAILYGGYRVNQPLGESLGRFALVQRSEPVEYGQQLERESDMFRAYATDTLRALDRGSKPVNAVVWPESMFTGGNPWMMADSDATPPPPPGPQSRRMTSDDLQRAVAESREYFLQRAGYLLDAISGEHPDSPPPHLIVGSGVVHYRQVPEVYCGVIHIHPEKKVEDWYGKTHLVMFGEYIPILPYIPGLRSLVPPELGLRTGPGAKRFHIGDAVVSPNVCIETAVERVTIDQLRGLQQTGDGADVVVTVTNDGWFDDSSIIDHHRRCAQLVAVGSRRPILSAANNGPTVWIDSHGQVVEQVPKGTSGILFAEPRRDSRNSLYVRIGDWPARICVAICLLGLLPRRRISGLSSSS